MKYLVVDDHSLIREALRGVLRELSEDATVLEASNAAAALDILGAHPDVDLVLLDLHLPDCDGLSVLATMGRRHPGTAVVMLSGDLDRQTIHQALAQGAQGFMPKSEPREVLLRALALVQAGGVYVPPAAMPDLQLAQARAVSRPEEAGPDPRALGLTERQVQVLALLMEGKNNKLICRALDLAEPTVKNHVSAIFRALGVGSRTEAVLAVTRLGWSFPRIDQR